MAAIEPKKPEPAKKKAGPVADTLTIPGNWDRGGRKAMKKASQAPIKKPGRRRP